MSTTGQGHTNLAVLYHESERAPPLLQLAMLQWAVSGSVVSSNFNRRMHWAMLHRVRCPQPTPEAQVIALSTTKRTRQQRRRTLRAEAKPEGPQQRVQLENRIQRGMLLGSESAESQFAKELKRRGIEQDPLSSARKFPSERWPRAEEAYYEESPPLMTEDQYRKSRALSSEGLEGLIPRAKELLTLGGTFTLSFLPAVGIVVAVAAALYFVFGESLLHFGSADMSPPTYVDPYSLLGYPYTDQ